jgi:hypothetical protein
MTEHVWTHRQFEEMSWHDNYVHAIRVVEGEFGSGELVLDLDYILEWLPAGEGCRFRILPVDLRFLEVTRLRIALDYATPTAGLVPFALDRIERLSEQRDRYVAQVWKLIVSWPEGEISFEANGFEQRGVAAPIESRGQYLSPKERHRHVQF